MDRLFRCDILLRLVADDPAVHQMHPPLPFHGP
jgi:hypothetical protein